MLYCRCAAILYAPISDLLACGKKFWRMVLQEIPWRIQGGGHLPRRHPSDSLTYLTTQPESRPKEEYRAVFLPQARHALQTMPLAHKLFTL